MNRISFFTAAALLALSSAAFSHGNESHAANAPTAKEQKDWGIAGDADKAQRTITLRMTDDMRFTPDHFSVKRGETVRLRVENKGVVMHEVVLGTKQSLQEHADLMLKFPEMEHAEPYMAHVAPAKREDLVWQFNRAGSFDFACLIAGHFQAGMRGTFTVTQ
ncbi:cupredoxin family protein [Diaphorobacter sp. HDW4A]|uniref:cupredoxin domain-containing protein n=1 Tax=Diaphorobacter sp. HDW4A TaxID=2714924 RepID=UPI00140BD8E0|nr:cupredoxin family protein [Diaphorobacter sp. HDW4A]QIL79614.1 cupredoxin family protein [Diaphorobacter sp. HDW4A]